MPFYDDGESFTAGDDDSDTVHFDNSNLVLLIQILEVLIPDDGLASNLDLRKRIRLAILREIYGEAEDI